MFIYWFTCTSELHYCLSHYYCVIRCSVLPLPHLRSSGTDLWGGGLWGYKPAMSLKPCVTKSLKGYQLLPLQMYTMSKT